MRKAGDVCFAEVSRDSEGMYLFNNFFFVGKLADFQFNLYSSSVCFMLVVK